MTDPLLDDVKALLNNDFGDDRILKQICRACERDEIISNYERNYVRKLAEKHLGKKPEFVQTSHVEKKDIVSNVIMPEIQQTPRTQTFETKSPPSSYSNSKNKKIFLGFGIIAIVVIIASVVSFSEITDEVDDNVIITNPISSSFSIQTDLTSYVSKDLISISGISDTLGTVNLSIENQNNELVWTEKVSLKNDGIFSTLTIAGGPGWESSGTYTVKVDNGKETISSTFSFTA